VSVFESVYSFIELKGWDSGLLGGRLVQCGVCPQVG
jgi:hypothetical protein